MDFIAIEINGEFIDLPPDTVINVEYENSIFDGDNVKGLLTFPFNLWQTKQNKKVFGLPEILGNRRVNRVFNCKVYLGGPNGALFLKGLFRIRNISDGRYICNLNAAAANLAESVRNKKLTDLEYDGERNIVPFPYIAVQLTGAGTTGTVKIQMSSLSYTVPFNTSIAQTMEDLADAFNADPDMGINGMSEAVAIGDTIRFFSNTVDTYPIYVGFPVSTGGTGRTIAQVDGGNTLAVRDHMESLLGLLYPSADYAFFPVKNPDAYEGDNTDYAGYVNYYHSGHFSHNDGTAGNEKKYPITLYPYLLYVLDKVFTEHGYIPKGSFLEISEMKRLVIYNNFLNDLYYVNHDVWAKSFNIANHVPEISIGEFLKALKNGFSLGFFFDLKKNEVEIIPLKEILESREYDDMTAQIEPENDIEMREGDGYTLKYNRDSNDDHVEESTESLTGKTRLADITSASSLPAASEDYVNSIILVLDINLFYECIRIADGSTVTYEWQYHSDNINDIVIGNGKQEIPIGFSTIPQYNPEAIVSLPDKNWTVPYVKHPCSSINSDLGKNPFSFRLLFYRGMYPDSTASNYPLGTALNFNWNRSSVGSYSLGTEGEFGIFETFNQPWINFLMAARPVTKKVRWTLPQLLSLKMQRKKRILNKNYIIKKISLPITMKGLGVSTVEFYST